MDGSGGGYKIPAGVWRVGIFARFLKFENARQHFPGASLEWFVWCGVGRWGKGLRGGGCGVATGACFGLVGFFHLSAPPFD